jgi:hypothetical protein
MWQKCPICDGTGKNYNGSPIASSAPFCPTCNGHRIISELTGKPPSYEIKTDVTTRPCNSFEPSSATSSATTCKQCGKEKWLHPTHISYGSAVYKDEKTEIEKGSATKQIDSLLLTPKFYERFFQHFGTIAASDSLNVSNTKYDLCVMCGKETIYEKSCPVAERVGYVEGAGQLCSSCYKY